MKDLIFCVAYILCAVICVAFFGFIVINSKKPNTSKNLKIRRNLCIAISVTAFIASICLPSLSFGNFLYPILTVPVFLLNAKSYHESMIFIEKIEIVAKKFFKTQPIDVEYKELN